jgi:HPt (histidine-containing phosphotransfer) domain-containing protein
VLTKPIDPDLLFQTLAKWLQAPDLQALPAPGQKKATTSMVATPAVAPITKLELPPVGDLPVWDASALTRIVGDKPEAHARLLAKYLLTAQETVAAIQRAAEAGQWTLVADQAHKLKSSSRSVGAMQLGALCEGLERSGRGNQADLCGLLVQAVAQSYAQMQARLADQSPPSRPPST